MKVILGIPDEDGCGHYRVRYPGIAVRALGHDVMQAHTLPIRMRTDGKRSWVGKVELDDDVDVVVMQRPLSLVNLQMIDPLQAKGIAVVVDIDDDFSCIDPQHHAWTMVQPQHNSKSNRVHLARACNKADFVTCTTPALARRYARHGRVLVLPNCVPAAMCSIGQLVETDGKTVGWAGHTETHPNDLQVTHGGVATAVRQVEGKFLNVGSGSKVAQYLGFEQDEIEVTGSVEFQDYPYAVARFDCGIVPLDDTQFNEAKSYLKGLEMAALGVPFVASPTADYRRLAAEGIGITAKSRARSWANAVTLMLGDEGRDRAEASRRVVKAEHTYEGNAWRWLEAWEAALRNRHGLKKVAA